MRRVFVYKVSGREPVKPYIWGGIEGSLGRVGGLFLGLFNNYSHPFGSLEITGFRGLVIS